MSTKVILEWTYDNKKYRIKEYYTHFKVQEFHTYSKSWQDIGRYATHAVKALVEQLAFASIEIAEFRKILTSCAAKGCIICSTPPTGSD